MKGLAARQGRMVIDSAVAEDEAQLLHRARSRPADFAPLYERYFPRVYAYCLRRVGRPEEAEDLASSVFARALVGAASYRGGSVAAWLFRIARDMVVDHPRHDRPLLSLDVDPRASLIDPNAAQDPVLDRMVDAAARAQVARPIAALPEEQREILALTVAGGTLRQGGRDGRGEERRHRRDRAPPDHATAAYGLPGDDERDAAMKLLKRRQRAEATSRLYAGFAPQVARPRPPEGAPDAEFIRLVVATEQLAAKPSPSDDVRARVRAGASGAPSLAIERRDAPLPPERPRLRPSSAVRKRTVVAAVLALLVVVGGVIAQIHKSPDPTPTVVAVSGGDPLASFGYAGTLPMLVNGGEGFPTPDLIMQGRVASARVYQVAAPSLPPKPGVSLPAQEPHTAYTIAVSEIITASRSVGSEPITVTMRGAADASGAAEAMGLPPLEEGEEYLLFLVRQPDGTYQMNGGPQGYLRVKGGRAELVAPAPVIDQLAGKEVAEVKRQVKGAKRK